MYRQHGTVREQPSGNRAPRRYANSNLHPKGSKHWASKLTESDVREILRLLATGDHTQTEVAERFGVTGPTINNINTGRTWAHLDRQGGNNGQVANARAAGMRQVIQNNSDSLNLEIRDPGRSSEVYSDTSGSVVLRTGSELMTHSLISMSADEALDLANQLTKTAIGARSAPAANRAARER